MNIHFLTYMMPTLTIWCHLFLDKQIWNIWQTMKGWLQIWKCNYLCLFFGFEEQPSPFFSYQQLRQSRHVLAPPRLPNYPANPVIDTCLAQWAMALLGSFGLWLFDASFGSCLFTLVWAMAHSLLFGPWLIDNRLDHGSFVCSFGWWLIHTRLGYCSFMVDWAMAHSHSFGQWLIHYCLRLWLICVCKCCGDIKAHLLDLMAQIISMNHSKCLIMPFEACYIWVSNLIINAPWNNSIPIMIHCSWSAWHRQSICPGNL